MLVPNTNPSYTIISRHTQLLSMFVSVFRNESQRLFPEAKLLTAETQTHQSGSVTPPVIAQVQV